jgi:putative ATPase
MHIPLYEKLRPQVLSEIVGQDHLVGENGAVKFIVQSGKPVSLLLYGPPGCGKTTLARLYAKAFNLPFTSFSGVLQSTAELKKLIKEGQETPLFHRQHIVFVDEIHRFNKAQQDLFLPFLEDGTLILIGATTENPSFVLNNALLSRLWIVTLNTLTEVALEQILVRYETVNGPLPVTPMGRTFLVHLAQGDGRYLLNLLETLQRQPGTSLDVPELTALFQKRPPLYDKDQDGHYNLISALHKSVRGSDPDASLYWLCRMLAGGEDPLFIARRLVRMATEDVGLADPQALPLALSAFQTYQLLGSPEGELALAQMIIYLALAPKSNAAYTAYQQCQKAAADTGNLSPPKTILNAPTQWMKETGHGDGYQYDHDTPHAFSGQNYFPPSLERPSFYHPVERGFEREMKKRMAYFEKLRKQMTV